MPICQEKAVEVWYAWLASHIPRIAESNARSWTSWITDYILDVSGIDSDERALVSSLHQSGVLFEVEPSNLYRDGLASAGKLVDLVRTTSLCLSDQDIERIREAKVRVDGLLTQGAKGSDSPIDDGWEARRVLQERSRLLDSLSLL